MQRVDLRRQDATGSVARLQTTLASYAGHLRHDAAGLRLDGFRQSIARIGYTSQCDTMFLSIPMPITKS